MGYVIAFFIGVLVGLVGLYIYDRKKIKEKEQDIEFLEGQIKEGQKEFIEMRHKIIDNGDLIIKQQKKIDAIKKKAGDVKNENKKDTIDDLINFFNH